MWLLLGQLLKEPLRPCIHLQLDVPFVLGLTLTRKTLNVCSCILQTPLTNLIESTHPGDGADVIGDGDQHCSGQVLLRHRLSLLFEHHVPKTIMKIAKH